MGRAGLIANNSIYFKSNSVCKGDFEALAHSSCRPCGHLWGHIPGGQKEPTPFPPQRRLQEPSQAAGSTRGVLAPGVTAAEEGTEPSQSPFPTWVLITGGPHHRPSTPRFCTLPWGEDNHLRQTKGQSNGKAAAPQSWLLSRRAGPGRLLSPVGGQRGRQKLRLLCMSLLGADHRPLQPAVPEHGSLRNSFPCSHLILLQ